MQERIELLFITLFLSAATLIVSKHNWRLRWVYFVVSILFGTVAGLVANRTPLLYEWDYLVSAGATLMGPAILIWLRGKTLEDVIEELKDMKKGADDA